MEGLIQGTAPVQPQAQPQFQQQPQNQFYAPQQPAQPTIDPDQAMTWREAQAWAPQAVQQAVQPQLEQLAGMQASLALSSVKQKYQRDFEKWGPEIMTRLSSVPKHLYTLENLETVVKFVRADHVDELAREEAARLVAVSEPTLRSSGGAATIPGAPPRTDFSLQSEKLPQEFRAKAQALGLTEQGVDEWCRANQITRDQFFAQFAKPGVIITETSSTDPQSPFAQQRTGGQ